MENRIPKDLTRLLILFSFAMFVQTTSALSIIGALSPIAHEWHITPAAAALLVTAFGATFAISAPLLQMLVGHWVRRTQILVGLMAMTLGAAAFALAPSYPLLFSARVAMGLGAALLSPVLLALGSSLVPPRQQGSALALISMGISIATVIGVPTASWLALHLGPRALFGALALVLAGTAGLVAAFVRDRSRGERVSPRQALHLLGTPATLSGLLVVFFITAGIFATYTMITPIMHDVYGISAKMISGALLLYGLSGLTGNLFVRRASSVWSAETLLRGAMLGLIGIFAVLLTTPLSVAILLAALLAWPFVSDVVWPSQQRRMIELEPDFRGIALALSSSFLFSGMAFGSALGGMAYAKGGFAAVLAASILLVSAGLGALTVSIRSRASKTNRFKTLDLAHGKA
jgi:predicted MFS family arabinose efflux permease